jgi:solute carrier family 25 uncoupling protein 27
MRPVRPAHYADSFWCTYVISVAAACVAETATYPLDLTKTRLQIQGEVANTAGKTMVNIIRQRSLSSAISIETTYLPSINICMYKNTRLFVC